MGPALRGAGVIQGGQGRPPLQSKTGTAQNGTSRTPSPTHSVIARSEATRQSVLPSPKKRIPTPVTRSLARNDSAARWERRDTWVPPYGVRRSSRADRVVRPYKAEQEPCETGRRGRRPLHTLSLRGTKRRGNPFSSAQRDGFPRQCVPQGHLLRGAHWLGMTALRAGNGGTHGSRPTGCGGHPGRTEASAPTKQNRNRAKRDVGDAVPYTLCHCEERSDAAIRSPQPKETDSHTSDIGHWRGITALRAGNGGTHGSRPTGCGGHPGRTEASAPTTGRRGRRPLRNHKGCVQWADRGIRPYNGTVGTACHTDRRGAARTEKFRNFFFPLSASAGLRRLYSDDTGRPPVL